MFNKNKSIFFTKHGRKKMRKSLIVTGAIAATLTAMPVNGVFADVTDTVQITINSSCTIGGTTSTSGAGKSFTKAMTNGSLQTWDATSSTGGKIVVSCNAANGWNVKAVGSGAGTPVTSMKPTGSGTPIATGTATSGATSNWAFKLAGTNVVSGYTSFKAVPATATKVAGASASTSEETIYTGYRVWISATQQADSYQGRVTYTVAAGNS